MFEDGTKPVCVSTGCLEQEPLGLGRWSAALFRRGDTIITTQSPDAERILESLWAFDEAGVGLSPRGIRFIRDGRSDVMTLEEVDAAVQELVDAGLVTAVRETHPTDDGALRNWTITEISPRGPLSTAPPDPEPPASPMHHVWGTPGADQLFGTDGQDVMSGGAGYDALQGGAGDDVLTGGPDGSTLFGQPGADVFVFSGGDNRLMDFDAAQGDRAGGVSQAYLDAEGSAQQVGEHLAVYFGDNPWDADGPGALWLVLTTGLPEDDWLA